MVLVKHQAICCNCRTVAMEFMAPKDEKSLAATITCKNCGRSKMEIKVKK